MKLFVKTGIGSDFCESFKENNYRIDSVLSVDYHNLFLFIESDYWPIDISSSLFGTDVRLLSTESKTSFLFRSHYTMTFVTVYDKKQIIGLFSVSFEQNNNLFVKQFLTNLNRVLKKLLIGEHMMRQILGIDSLLTLRRLFHQKSLGLKIL